MVIPPPATLAEVAVDSSLLYGTGSRRFVMSLWEQSGHRVPVLPKGARELHGILQESEEDYWDTRFAKEPLRTNVHIPSDVRERVTRLARAATGAWVNDELGWDGEAGRRDSALVAVPMTREQKDKAILIAKDIPLSCFRGNSKTNHMGDRSLIAQCVAAGYKIFAADNRSMMLRNRINDWLKRKGLADEDMVLNGDDAIDRAGSWRDRPNDMLRAALCAALPSARRSRRREDEIVTDLIDRMGRQGLPLTAESCRDAWLGPDMPSVYAEARAIIEAGGSLARATEQRRLDARKAAAEEAGYELR